MEFQWKSELDFEKMYCIFSAFVIQVRPRSHELSKYSNSWKPEIIQPIFWNLYRSDLNFCNMKFSNFFTVSYSNHPIISHSCTEPAINCTGLLWCWTKWKVTKVHWISWEKVWYVRRFFQDSAIVFHDLLIGFLSLIVYPIEAYTMKRQNLFYLF